MAHAKLHPQESLRLKALRALMLLDTLPEREFDDLTRLASSICGTPVALISLMDEHRQWFKSRVGTTLSETPRDYAVCAHTILKDEVMVVPDLRSDTRFLDNPLVHSKPGIQFYAGAPIKDPRTQLPIGTVCVLDYEAKQMSPWQIEALQTIAAQANKLIELRCVILELHQVQEILHRSAKLNSLGQSAGEIAHEINTPLAILSSSADLALTQLKADPPQIAKAVARLNQIEATVERVARIVRGLKNFSRNEDQDAPVVCSLREAVTEAHDFCAQKFKNGGVDLKILIDQDFPVSAQPSRLVQVILNLMNNAFDACSTASEKWVRVEASLELTRVQLSVSDSGSGVPPEIRDRIMQPFFTTKGPGQGTGLGLSISKSIVESFQGRLSLKNGSPHTCFVIDLPLSVKLAA